jgi:Putative addiction module component
MATQTLAEQVLALPLEERIGLAEALWKSIGHGLAAGDEREATEQALRRDAEISSGAAVSRSHDEVMKSARRAIGCG